MRNLIVRSENSFNAYYGFASGLSIQTALSSRDHSGNPEWSLKAVNGLVGSEGSDYHLDMILEHHTGASKGSSGSNELSLPSVWQSGDNTLVIHPVGVFRRDVGLELRGHCGLFHTFSNRTVIGCGAEFESAQSSSSIGRRLIEANTGTSLFYGTTLPGNFFGQCEVMKGWGAGLSNRDYSVALI